jgi:quercetin dioxygenase-like cupin family protein
MAKAGDVLDIKVAGRIVFRQTAADTSGELLEFDYFVPPHKETGSEHLHPRQEERFEVVKGRMRGRLDGEERTVDQGEASVMPAGVQHFWWNDGDEEAQLLVDVRPALRTEEFYEVMAGVSVNQRGIPNPLHGSLVMMEYRDEFIPNRMRNPLMRWVVVPVLATVGKLFGYSARLGEGRR